MKKYINKSVPSIKKEVMVQMPIGVKEWLELLTAGHKFGKGGAYSTGNNNMCVTLDSAVDVKVKGDKVISLPAGCRVGIFRPYRDHGDEIVAAAFRENDQVVIRQGGSAGIGSYQGRIGPVNYRTAAAYF